MNSAEFQQAEMNYLSNTQPIDDAIHVQIYGSYMQATQGDNYEERPGAFETYSLALWQSWSSQRSVSRDQAETEYTAIIAAIPENPTPSILELTLRHNIEMSFVQDWGLDRNIKYVYTCPWDGGK